MDQSDSIMLYKEKRISTPGIMSCLEQHLCSLHEIYLLLSTPKIYHNTLRTAKKPLKKENASHFSKVERLKVLNPALNITSKLQIYTQHYTTFFTFA